MKIDDQQTYTAYLTVMSRRMYENDDPSPREMYALALAETHIRATIAPFTRSELIARVNDAFGEDSSEEGIENSETLRDEISRLEAYLEGQDLLEAGKSPMDSAVIAFNGLLKEREELRGQFGRLAEFLRSKGMRSGIFAVSLISATIDQIAELLDRFENEKKQRESLKAQLDRLAGALQDRAMRGGISPDALVSAVIEQIDSTHGRLQAVVDEKMGLMEDIRRIADHLRAKNLRQDVAENVASKAIDAISEFRDAAKRETNAVIEERSRIVEYIHRFHSCRADVLAEAIEAGKHLL